MSDPKRLADVTRHIANIKERAYPIVVGQDAPSRIEERSWADVPEQSKLAILQDAVDWSGVSNRDRAHILLSEVDPGRISDAQRNGLIDMAVVEGPRAATVHEGGERPMSATEAKATPPEQARADPAAGKIRHAGEAYEAVLKAATERAMFRMQGKAEERVR